MVYGSINDTQNIRAFGTIVKDKQSSGKDRKLFWEMSLELGQL